MAATISGTIDIAGFQLKYIIEGQGLPALVIGSALYYPKTFSDAIIKHLQFIFVDHRGFVPPPSESLDHTAFELDVLLQDIETIRKQLGLQKFIIIGHSGHAFLALEYAKKFPDDVLGVVMIGVTPDYSAATHQAAERFFEEEASPERKALFKKNMSLLPAMIEAQPQKRFVSYCLAVGPKGWYDYNFNAASLWEGVYTNMQMIDYVWGVVFRDIDITRGLDQLKQRVFLALGKYDFQTGPAYLWEPIKNNFADLTIKIFEKSSHTPQLEEAELFDKELINWINRLEHKSR
jgi:proline iminopeptidase